MKINPLGLAALLSAFLRLLTWHSYSVLKRIWQWHKRCRAAWAGRRCGHSSRRDWNRVWFCWASQCGEGFPSAF